MQTVIERYEAWPQTPRGVSISAVCISLLLHGLLLWVLQGNQVAAAPETPASGPIAVRILSPRATSGDLPATDSVQQVLTQVPEPARVQTQTGKTAELAAVERVIPKPRPSTKKPRKAKTRSEPVRAPAQVRSRPPPSTTPLRFAAQPTDTAMRASAAVAGSPARVPESERGLRVTPIYAPPPEYPRLARRLGLEGTVLLRVTLRESGAADDIEIISSSGHSVFDDSALAAVRTWQFQLTGERNPSTIPWVDVPIRFTLAR